MLSRVADKSTAIPDGTGNFTDLGLYFRAVSGNNVVFRGSGSSGQEGIYLFNGTTLSRVADKTTAIPNGTGNFTNFFTWRVSGANVAFRANGTGQQGIHVFNGAPLTLSRVADLNTPIPSGTGNFTSVDTLPVVSGNNIVFVGLGSSFRAGSISSTAAR